MLMVNRITVKHVSWVRQHYTNNVQIYEIIRHDFIQTILHDFTLKHALYKQAQTCKKQHTHTHTQQACCGWSEKHGL